MGRTGKRRKATILWGSLLVIWVSATWGCRSRGEPSPRPPADQINLTAADSGKTVSVKVGQTVVISLWGAPSIPDAGWSMDKLDGQSAEQVGEVRFVEEGGPARRKGEPYTTGNSGNFIFTFKAVRAGKSVVRLLGDEIPGQKPDKEFTVTFDVKGEPAAQPASRPATDPASEPTNK